MLHRWVQQCIPCICKEMNTSGRLDLQEAHFLSSEPVLTVNQRLTLAGISDLVPFVKELHQETKMVDAGEISSLPSTSPFQPHVSTVLENIELVADELFSDTVADTLVQISPLFRT